MYLSAFNAAKWGISMATKYEVYGTSRTTGEVVTIKIFDNLREATMYKDKMNRKPDGTKFCEPGEFYILEHEEE